jgi:pyruvate kinase
MRACSDALSSPHGDDHVMSTVEAPAQVEARLLAALEALRAEVVHDGCELFETWCPSIDRRTFEPSALNLAHYLVLRRHDLRPLQEELMPLGLSSLGRCEARVLPNLDAVIASLTHLVDPAGEALPHPRPATFYRGNRLLRHHTDAVFGPAPPNRQVRIMVTVGAAGRDRRFVRALVESGADVVRVNCAHDEADTWCATIANVRRAAADAGRECRVLADLEGPRARTGRVGGELRVEVGDRIRLVGRAPKESADPPQVECSLPAAVGELVPGAEVCLDEGRIRFCCEEAHGDSAILRTVRLESKGRIRPNKGLNFPGTPLSLDPLTAKDLADLAVVAPLVDIVGYSFVQSAGDMHRLQCTLDALVPDRRPAIVAKVESAVAVRNLPEIIVQGAGGQPLAVMIARGDLAVEIGFVRLAEIQEEILWLCEAAHAPVVWATQVLDTFVRKGSHSRGEITDAAMAERAECVMLNKGGHVLEAVIVLDDVLGRMEAHQNKKTSRLRALRSW